MDSKSIADTGLYTITLSISDPEPKTITSSFTVEVLNTAPRIISSPPNLSMVHGKSLSIPLTGLFIDDDGDALTLSATYCLSGGTPATIPDGIFS
jgi:hypothetical protein